MKSFQGQVAFVELKNGVIELALHREPCNEIGSFTLEELERFATALESLGDDAHALIIYSSMQPGFLCRSRSPRTLSPLPGHGE